MTAPSFAQSVLPRIWRTRSSSEPTVTSPFSAMKLLSPMYLAIAVMASSPVSGRPAPCAVTFVPSISSPAVRTALTLA